MGAWRRRDPAVCFLFWFLMVLEPCVSLNHEGFALLRFKEMIDADPCDALMDWDGENASPCSWFGVGCSDDGRVMTLNLANLGLKGVLPPEIGSLIHMHSLILHNNSFYGIIPMEIGNLQQLKVLDLGYNNFNGGIPSELRNILFLEFLFLKGNRFSGGLPVELHEITRLCESQVHKDPTLLNRAFTARNEKSAKIRRILANKQKHSQKNRMLGSENVVFSPGDMMPPPLLDFSNAPTNLPLHPGGTPPRSSSPPPPHPFEPIPCPAPALSPTIKPTSQESKSKSRSSLTIYASIGAAICFVVLALSASIFICYHQRKCSIIVPLSPTASRQLQTTALGGITLFRRSELETACEGFSNIIGTLPGFTVYKGTLPCGAEIAVVSALVNYACGWSTTAEAQFKNKVEVLSKVNHKNLMNIVGYCEDEEPFTRMMVFEYVSNGSLFEHLHIKEAEQLNWKSRVRIAMGVLYCLNYMHHQNPPVTLRNLSTSCIYLTEDNAAKVSDISFGGDRKEGEDRFDGSDEHNTVYKFALLLLETISGRRPYSDDDGLLILWAHRYLIGDTPLMGMVDPTLKSVPEGHINELTELVKLCLSDDLRQRPTVAEVTRRMEKITGITQDQAIPRNSALWWAELEIITS